MKGAAINHFNFPSAVEVHFHLPPNDSAQLDRIEAALTTVVQKQEQFMSAVSQDLQTIKDDLTTANTSITGMRGDIARLNDKIQSMSADATSVAEVKALAAEVAANAGAGDTEGGDPVA